MKKFLKNLGISLLGVIVVGLTAFYVRYSLKSSRLMALAGPEAPSIVVDQHSFRDLNKNGELDTYEDSRADTEARIADLLSQMTIAEKAGMMFVTVIAPGNDGGLQEIPTPTNLPTLVAPINSELVHGRNINHFNVMFIPEPRLLAEWVNNIQKEAEKTRLGIPITLGSDPRHGFAFNPFTDILSPDFSLWPDPLGLAATNDAELVREFGNIARQEYTAVGLRFALHPMADLATEPRWGRIAGTFGEDAHLVTKMVYTYVQAFQGEELGPTSVATTVKHFPSSGAREGGHPQLEEDGKYDVFPGDNFDYHLIPYKEGAFSAGAANVMVAYGIQMGRTSLDVGASYNKEIVIDLLRTEQGFDGVVMTDYGIVSGLNILGTFNIIPPIAWGVEDLSKRDRLKLLVENDIDLVGGDYRTELVIDLVQSGEIPESRLDRSVRRLLRQKFALGLFENPYVDPGHAARVVGNPEFRTAGLTAQKRAIVLLKNGDDLDNRPLPLRKNISIYVENIDIDTAARYGTVVENIEDADFAILRLKAPFEADEGIFAAFSHEGDLSFRGDERERILGILDAVPTVVDIYLDRPAVIPEIAEKAAGIIVNFGAIDEAVLDVLFGNFHPGGKLPIEMPASMQSVNKQFEDVPYDSGDPLYPFGYGLNYDHVN